MKGRALYDDPDDLIPLARAARMLGLSADAIRKRLAGTENLTLVDQSNALSLRPRYFMVLGEVRAHRQRLIDSARARVDVMRFWKNDDTPSSGGFFVGTGQSKPWSMQNSSISASEGQTKRKRKPSFYYGFSLGVTETMLRDYYGDTW